MLNETDLIELNKGELPVRTAALSAGEIDWLVDLVSVKDDKIRYGAFLLLNERSLANADVFPYWNVFAAKLQSDNSYQRSLGVMLLAANARWDDGEKTAAVLEDYLAILRDEKPITVRQCVQSLALIVPYHPALSRPIAQRLISLNLLEIRDTMRKLVLLDIVDVLLLIRCAAPIDEIDLSYQNFAFELAGLPGKYDKPDGRLYLIYVDGNAAGCVAMRRFDADRAEMKRLYVRPAYRGFHLGKQLAERVIQEARQIGYRSVLLDTLSTMNRAKQLYRQLGFTEVEPYYESPVKGTTFLQLSFEP